MPRGIPNVKIDFDPDGNPASAEAPPAPEKRITMKLERHYRPMGDFEIVGHFQPEIKRRGPSGRDEIVQAEAFVPGEPAPAPKPGVGIAGKLWAGTILALPAEEAKTMRRAGIASVEIAD